MSQTNTLKIFEQRKLVFYHIVPQAENVHSIDACSGIISVIFERHSWSALYNIQFFVCGNIVNSKFYELNIGLIKSLVNFK